MRANLALPTDLRKEILQKNMTPSNWYGAFHSVWPLTLLFLLFSISADAAPLHAIWLLPAIGWVYYRIYFPLHDTCHLSLFTHKWLNQIVGNVLAGALVTPYDSFRKEHLFHHSFYSTNKDPGAVDYFVHFNNRGEMIRFLMSPLWGGTLLTKLRDNFRQIIGTNKSLDEREKRDVKGYISIVAVQSIVLLVVTSGLQIGELWRYPVFVLIPGATVFLFLSRLRMFLEHGSLNYSTMDYFSNPRITARTFECSGFELALLSGAGFKYHYEHHLLSGIPSCRLRTVHEEYFRGKYIDSEDTRPSYVRAIYELWTNLPARS